jgi:ribosomal protein L40E
MKMTQQPEFANPEALVCANCGQHLGPSDKYCRECGLPTVRQAQMQRAVPVVPADAPELKRVVEAPPEPPKPFLRNGPEQAAETETDLTTGSVLRATSPTFATQLAASTVLMVVVIVVLVALGILLLLLAFRP